jgi:hypothetical protein
MKRRKKKSAKSSTKRGKVIKPRKSQKRREVEIVEGSRFVFEDGKLSSVEPA